MRRPTPEVTHPRSTAPRGRHWVTSAGVVIASLFTLVAVGFQLFAHRSQPRTTGLVRLPGLQAEVTLGRDDRGVPAIEAKSRDDAIRALGFAHGQERFFQMDLLRRTAAGERAELLGHQELDTDLSNRRHLFRRRASRVMSALSDAERETLAVYAAGVNAGLASLSVRPVEYVILDEVPKPWRPLDSILVMHTIYIMMQDSLGELDYQREMVRMRIDRETYAYLFENGTHWSSTMDGTTIPIEAPSSTIWRKLVNPMTATGERAAALPMHPRGGSNAWAVSGAKTASGRAMLGNDLHLPLAMPTMWYLAQLSYPDSQTQPRTVTGATLPGLPLVFVGSNGSVAWGITASGIDSTDVVMLDLDPENSSSYQSPSGWKTFTAITETIKVRGGDEVTLRIDNTIWGPVIEERELDGHRLALKWAAHEPTAVNLQLAGFETADDVADALAVAARARLPAVNLVLADTAGNIGWTLTGYLPSRVGYDGSIPEPFASGTSRWAGALDAKNVPAVYNPPRGFVWNANQRSTAKTITFGDGVFYNSARAKVIEESLEAADAFTEQAFLNIMHDPTVSLLERWTGLLRQTIDARAIALGEKGDELVQLISSWDGEASADSAVHPVVRRFRINLIQDVAARLIGTGETTDYMLSQFDLEEPVWMLLQDAYTTGKAKVAPFRPELRSIVASALDLTLLESDMLWGENTPLAERVWGGENRLNVTHPLSAISPLLRPWLDLPDAPLAGDDHAPLVSGPMFGAAVRVVVSPGDETNGLFQLPGGQSGHPLSVHYDDLFPNWMTLRGSSFVPGEIHRTLRFLPTENPYHAK